jgi:hypothetical protein
MRTLIPLAAMLALAACSDSSPTSESMTTHDVAAEAPAVQAVKGAGGSGPAPVEVAIPRIAYVYKLGFRLPGDRIAAAQRGHVAACEKLGPARCQVLALERSGGEEEFGSASLKLRVQTGITRPFLDQLGRSVSQAGGRTVAESQQGEDVSKQMVDASARIAQRELLVSRLMEILRTRDGKVGDLVEAERSVAQAQEELDQAKGWLAELSGRVAMSTVEIGYDAVAPSVGADNFGGQIGNAVTGSATAFVIALRGLLTLLIFLLPWALLGGAIWWLTRNFRRSARTRYESRDIEPKEPSSRT